MEMTEQSTRERIKIRVNGEKDLLKQPRYSEIIAAEIPNSLLEIIPHAAHAPMWEQSKKFHTLILNFLTTGAGGKG